MHKTLDLITYGCGNAFDLAKFKPIHNHTRKPTGGLWASPLDSAYGWRDWCEANDFGRLDSEFRFTLTGQVYVIDSLRDLRRIPLYQETAYWAYPDWEALCRQGYDAVLLTVKGERATRHSDPVDLYGWDCESVLVMNPSCVTSPTLSHQASRDGLRL